MTKKGVSPLTIRQGDVALFRVAELPHGCTPVPLDNDGSIVLAYGERTGHRHAVYDHAIADHIAFGPEAAGEIAEAAIARAKARLWQAPNGDRYLEVRETVSLTHEEHSAHAIPPGIYELPVQVEASVANMPRQVAD